ncbi:hypothetical protein ER308_01210 [Egibacter rhizosphaerae]|uniref:SWIM-type domain-containing protein n=1 Tax=Egibacter rhizosphaerae TaxID=1670831 RepID=A0A411YAR8_9ACTN|nr:SWIM zinc finger family protein [Egibacter rhizosphaerae]QBI18323.1 hypothetical protein ER308_01210 [Egibacter rhizosphaerae]
MSPPRATFGLTWWGQRWIGALEALGAAYANRLPRGRTYARKGTVEGLTVDVGEVTARVVGSRATPYRVRLRLPVFTDAQWAEVVAALAGEIRHVAALLDGQMPSDVDEVLAACGVSLFPGPRELDTRCSCPDAVNPCKHVAAVHYTLAQTFDADPFLLPELRGRDRDTLLAELRAARAGGAVASAETEPDEPIVALEALSAGSLFDARGDLAAITVQPRPPEDPGAAVRRLGAPPGADAEVLEALVEGAAEQAWGLATGEGEVGEDLDPELVDAVRDLAPATSAELAEALGATVADVRERVRPLLEAGAVRRSGHARGTRYWV